MRVLKNDFVKYSHDEETTNDQEEIGWKYIHGDVFRYPPQKSLFCVFLGSGTQLLALAIFIFMLALVGVFYPYNRGALYTALVVIYALTSGIAGYIATSFYCQLEGKNWVLQFIYTSSEKLLAVLFFTKFIILKKGKEEIPLEESVDVEDNSAGIWVKLVQQWKTKIVCTIGPSTSTPKMIRKLAEAGMNVARMCWQFGMHMGDFWQMRKL